MDLLSYNDEDLLVELGYVRNQDYFLTDDGAGLYYIETSSGERINIHNNQIYKQGKDLLFGYYVDENYNGIKYIEKQQFIRLRHKKLEQVQEIEPYNYLNKIEFERVNIVSDDSLSYHLYQHGVHFVQGTGLIDDHIVSKDEYSYFLMRYNKKLYIGPTNHVSRELYPDPLYKDDILYTFSLVNYIPFGFDRIKYIKKSLNL